MRGAMRCCLSAGSEAMPPVRQVLRRPAQQVHVQMHCLSTSRPQHAGRGAQARWPLLCWERPRNRVKRWSARLQQGLHGMASCAPPHRRDAAPHRRLRAAETMQLGCCRGQAHAPGWPRSRTAAPAVHAGAAGACHTDGTRALAAYQGHKGRQKPACASHEPLQHPLRVGWNLPGHPAAASAWPSGRTRVSYCVSCATTKLDCIRGSALDTATMALMMKSALRAGVRPQVRQIPIGWSLYAPMCQLIVSQGCSCSPARISRPRVQPRPWKARSQGNGTGRV